MFGVEPTEITNDTNKRITRMLIGEQMKGDKILHKELSYRVMDAVFEVHNTLGPGFIESVYEEALAHELGLGGIVFERQNVVTVRYKEHVVGDKIILELKAVSALTNAFKQQTLSYLKATDLKLGILINFGTSRVEYVRIVN